MKLALNELLLHLKYCAKQNEKDAKPFDPWEVDKVYTRAVATEQRRVIKLLKKILKRPK